MDKIDCAKIPYMSLESSATSTFDQTAPQAVGAIGILCKAAGDPLRIQILKVLQQNAYGVLELCQVFDIRQSAMSHHLKILSNAGLVSSRREGTTIFYRRNPLNPDIDLQTMQKALFKQLIRPRLTQMLLHDLLILTENALAPRWNFLIAMSHCLKKIRILLPVGQTMATVLKVF